MPSKEGRKIVNLGPAAALVLAEPDSVAEWTDEELLRGRRRVNGAFTGRDPTVVPRAVHQEIARRMVRIVWESGIPAAKTIQRQAAGEFILTTAEENAARAAATYVLDRLMGKAPERVELDVSSSVDPLRTPPPWVAELARQIAGQQEPEAAVINVEPLDDDDEPWQEDDE